MLPHVVHLVNSLTRMWMQLWSQYLFFPGNVQQILSCVFISKKETYPAAIPLILFYILSQCPAISDYGARISFRLVGGLLQSYSLQTPGLHLSVSLTLQPHVHFMVRTYKALGNGLLWCNSMMDRTSLLRSVWRLHNKHLTAEYNAHNTLGRYLVYHDHDEKFWKLAISSPWKPICPLWWLRNASCFCHNCKWYHD